MQYNFVLVSRRAESTKIRDELERNRLYRVEIVESAPVALERLKKPDVHCLVLNLESFNTDKVHLVTDLRDVGVKFPVIVMATYIQFEALQRIQDMPRTVVIEKPFEAKDLWGIAQKIVQGVPVAQRIHRRFYTNQQARFEKIANGQTYTGRVYNLSKGGAYLETDGASRLATGDMVRVSMQLDKVARAYNVDAEVVWSKAVGAWKGKPAIGVRFVSTNDVYRNLLNKL